MKKKHLTFSSGQTKKAGEKLAKERLKIVLRKNALVVGLEGDLGSGKTTFIQGFAKGLGIKEKILSPTFVIMKKFEIRNSKFENFYHVDCYRLQKPKELLELGFKKIIANPQNIVAIEWADKIRKILPNKTIWISFQFIDKKIRKIMLQ